MNIYNIDNMQYKAAYRKRMSRLLCVIGAMLMPMIFSACVPVNQGNSLLSAPMLPLELEEVKKVLDENFNDELDLISPIKGENSSSIQFVDLDSDGVDEVLVFHKIITDKYPVRITVLSRKNDNDWIINNTIKGAGYDVNKIVYSDMDNDGVKEIIVGWQYGTILDKGLTVYEYNKGEITEVFETLYTEFGVDDFTGDNTTELLTVRLDRNSGVSTAYLYDYDNNLMTYIDETDMDGYIGGYYSVKTGLASGGKKGFFIDASLGAHSAFTDLLVYNRGELHNVFYNEKWNVTEITYKAYPRKCKDIDNDGIIEIPILRAPVGYEEASMSDTPWITGWFKWDGDKGIKFSNNSYYNSDHGFEFLFPNHWDDNITIGLSGDNYDRISFDEYSKDGSTEIFDLKIIQSEKYESQKNDLEQMGYKKLGSTFKKVYLFKKNPDYPSDGPYNISAEEIIERFGIVYDSIY